MLLKTGNQTFYELLGIDATADKRAVTKAFRKLCLVYHPDHNKQPTANEDFQALKHVYDVLAGSSSRMAYNSRIRAAFNRRSSYNNFA
jgi:DnaJ-class molecular chaperone